MLASLLQRSVLPASGLLLVAGFVVQSSPLTGRLHEWTSARRPTADRPSGLSPAPAPASHRVVAEGRVVADPGAEVIVGTEAAGLIVRLPVEEKSVVRTGDLIAELNAADLRASRDEADARMAEAEADIRFFEREVRRDEALLARKAATPQGLDMNVRALQTARARRAAAVATRDRFDALIVKTRITAPIDGVVTARHVQPGETVREATALVTVADLKRVRIEAEVDEFDAAQVALGAPVTVTAEGFRGASWHARVEEIPDTVVGRRIRPEDPGRPIDARVLPVKIAPGEPTPLKLGQRVEVEIASSEAAPR
ncbi:MAG: efflux RND transporter periplasmic adaptor subunit [Planctomycetaceae bacterium]|nr:efflux RND transporter periplasmic adaptor subunit [Planctomycetaceae bacterium]